MHLRKYAALCLTIFALNIPALSACARPATPDTEASSVLSETVQTTSAQALSEPGTTDVTSEPTEPATTFAALESVPILEASGTKYTSDSVNIREQPDKDSPKLGSFAIGNSLEVTGVTYDGKWYRFDFNGSDAFISAAYLSDTMPEDSFAGQLSVCEGLEQLIIVEAESNDGQEVTVTMHERQNGIWVQILRTKGYVGYNGIDKEREGDGRTPTGVYGLSVPFGTKPDPGALLPYTQVDDSHWWIGDYESRYFNQLCSEDVPDRDWTTDGSQGEHLVDFSGYEYCLFIEYNTEGEVDKGCCIFLHCHGKNPYTTGCVSIPERDMIFILRHVREGCRILIDTAENLPGY